MFKLQRTCRQSLVNESSISCSAEHEQALLDKDSLRDCFWIISEKSLLIIDFTILHFGFFWLQLGVKGFHFSHRRVIYMLPTPSPDSIGNLWSKLADKLAAIGLTSSWFPFSFKSANLSKAWKSKEDEKIVYPNANYFWRAYFHISLLYWWRQKGFFPTKMRNRFPLSTRKGRYFDISENSHPRSFGSWFNFKWKLSYVVCMKF